MIKKTLLLSLAALLFTAGGASAQMLVSGWTFETTAPATAGPFAPESGNGAATGVHVGASTYSSPSGNGSTHSYSSNTWAVGDYYQFSLTKTAGTELFVSFGTYSSSTGPLNFSLEYSTDGGTTFTPNTSNAYTVGPTSFAVGTYQSADEKSFDITGLPAAAGTIIFRLADTSTTSANLTTPGTVATTGTSRVDDFNVATGGFVYPVPEPATYVYALGGLGGLILLQYRRRRSV